MTNPTSEMRAAFEKWAASTSPYTSPSEVTTPCLMWHAWQAAHAHLMPALVEARDALGKHRNWLAMVERQSLASAERNRGRFESLCDAELADAKNYAAMGKDFDKALTKINAALEKHK